MSTILVKILIKEIMALHIFHALQSSALTALGKHGATCCSIRKRK